MNRNEISGRKGAEDSYEWNGCLVDGVFPTWQASWLVWFGSGAPGKKSCPSGLEWASRDGGEDGGSDASAPFTEGRRCPDGESLDWLVSGAVMASAPCKVSRHAHLAAANTCVAVGAEATSSPSCRLVVVLAVEPSPLAHTSIDKSLFGTRSLMYHVYKRRGLSGDDDALDPFLD